MQNRFPIRESGFLWSMSLFYITDEYIKKMSAKTGVANAFQRISDQRVALYGSRGGKYEELVYLRGQNTDTALINTHFMDAWDKFAGAQGVTSTTRPSEKRRLFFREKTYP